MDKPRIRVVHLPTTGELLDQHYARHGYVPSDGIALRARNLWLENVRNAKGGRKGSQQ